MSEPVVDATDTVDEQPQMPAFTWKSAVQALVGIALAAGLIVFGLPWLAGTTWSEIGHRIGDVGISSSLLFMGIMLLGLWVYTFTLNAVWPGLGHGRAAIVNVSGSAVANTMPGGGATALAASWLILRSWGFRKHAISTGLIVSGVWNFLARAALPLIGLLLVARSSHDLPKSVATGAMWTAILGMIVLTAFVVALTSPHRTAQLGRVIDRFLSPQIAKLRRGESKGVAPKFEAALVEQQSRMAEVTKRGWFPMTFGVVGQLLIWFVLFWQIMRTVGVDLSVTDLFAAYAIGSLLRAVGVTPGGIGIAEAGIVLALVSWGADRPSAAAGALVFALFTHVAEIPLGVIGWLAWWLGPKVPMTTPQNNP